MKYDRVRKTKAGGFTLIEVLVSIALLFMTIGAVFYFYSHMMDNHSRLKEKYKVLRIAREFVDSLVFGHNPAMLSAKSGSKAVENYLLAWNIYPSGEPKELLFTSGIPPMVQLKRVHLQIFKKGTSRAILELQFLVNTIFEPGK